ncbi:hypothetical protein MPTK1_1g18720 [Marchantia polymorpha subsp. ruderalis]|uniref:Bulb-type lectin domain-containing protein n=2 Tax=Marchantia polymorpha TaxID=3197 RepID=A0A176WUB0_MARPO|nr:hypothetical protein AXG93_3562s1070 [Marchantia polymorpha subsp. ruderalis]PTQ50179.1 hypothetical protein MARPO_0001s0210 [Marchantia polymorpha]BBM99102.1 hypothetical protein Mp_1g18720 [Marchantia polymorpha subsp. ruderalis]|eukprot:PTQ50179.1 hypothetical protein MARPO_0001s0210 [Marchantia polymorpha]
MTRSFLLVLLGVGTVLLFAPQASAQGSNIFEWNFQERGDAICTNLATGVTIDNHPPYAMNVAGFSESDRNIIAYDYNDIYALGFEKYAPGAFYLSIYKWYPSNNTAGSVIFRAKGITTSTVDEGATLSILSNGSLDLKDSAGNLVWSTGTGSAGATRMEFNMDDGNIILYHSTGAIVWESRLNNGLD